MDWFGIKRRKKEKEKRLEEARREKELQTKISIRRTLNNMRVQSAKLETFKKDYIDKARKAALTGNKQTYGLAKSGLKLCLSKQKFLDAMIANFEIALQMNEMNKIVNEFIGSMNLISNEMKGITSTIDITKAQAAYERALANNEGQYEALDAFLKEAEGSIESYSGSETDVSDEELDRLIHTQAVDSESELDDEIEQKITALRQKMNQEE